MDRNIKYLLKFGEEKYIKDFPKGSLYCSNAKTFRTIEKDMKIKGQGDIREGAIPFSTNNITAGGRTVYKGKKVSMIGIPEPVSNIPIYCLYAVFEKDCTEDDGKIKINISKQIIRSHFPNANAVALIKEPKRFMKELEASIGAKMMSGLVHYFYIDDELKTADNSSAMDLNFAKFITNDQLGFNEDVKEKVCLDLSSVDYYKLLFSKDVYFKDEHEFRIILTDKMVERGGIFLFKTTLQIPIIDIDRFFSEMCVKSDEWK